MIIRVIIAALLFALTPCGAYAASVTASDNLPRGTILQEQDIDITLRAGESRADVSSAYVGMELKRSITKGYKLSQAYIGKPVIIRRNARVNMIYRAGSLQISAWGRALDEGAAGDVISVLNLDSRKRVQGRVLESGIIEVGP